MWSMLQKYRHDGGTYTFGMFRHVIFLDKFKHPRVDDKIKLYKSQLYKCANDSTYPQRDYIWYCEVPEGSTSYF